MLSQWIHFIFSSWLLKDVVAVLAVAFATAFVVRKVLTYLATRVKKTKRLHNIL